MSWYDSMRRLLRSLGVDLIPYNVSTHPLARRAQLLRHHQIDLVLDVGANRGQYARQLRQIGYQGPMISWEPSSTAFADLQRIAAIDPHWTVVHAALADSDATRTLNISRNNCSNSLLQMLPRHEKAAADSVYERTESVTVWKLDSVLPQYLGQASHLFMKVDVQGAERSVLDGAKESLPLISLMQLELSLVPLYAGETLLADMVRYLAKLQYVVVAVEPGYVERSSGQMLQVDVLFARQELLSR